MLDKSGVTRLVFIFKTFVVKIPNFTHSWDHFLLGLIGNIRESKTWKWNESKELLCPVLWASWGGWVLVMKRAEVFNDLEVDYTLWSDRGLDGDDKPRNYGILDGKIVKIDYGS